ncbi:integral membrane protein [Boeremia exigua]|uniref:uncharacterized protein n=1 Tax=Boeremia exigua TaxID=749465 RepID=UPI001E8CFD8F|nr:uncharacterized protein C7974DRAFT_40370 [Boeremia exigua]KAH6619001.1 integral membrane protein [Boeremia exigua]
MRAMRPPPPALRLAKPLATAYALGLLSSTSPRLARILVLFGRGKLTVRAAWLQSIYTLREALALHRFPTFCAVLIGGSTLLQIPIKAVLNTLIRLTSRPDHGLARVLARFLAALVSASAAFRLLNSAPVKYDALNANPPPVLNRFAPGPFDEPPEDPAEVTALSRPALAGRTMDLTLFTAVRALDVLVTSHPSLRNATRHLPVPLFCFSAATIMWAWFYTPSRLPRSYTAWIAAAAELDPRLVLALRHARYGSFVYGKDTGMAPLLGSLAADNGLPEALGDPAKTIPIPCQLIHAGATKSCELHALRRFARAWLVAARAYTPLYLLALALRVYKSRGARLQTLTRSLPHALQTAAHRSATLALFTALFHYAVCLSRTRLGPRFFPATSPQTWDAGRAVLAGCVACGLSVLVEAPARRGELALVVLPRAAGVWFPRRYEVGKKRWEEGVFVGAAAVVVTAAQEGRGRVRGVFGRVVRGVLDV